MIDTSGFYHRNAMNIYIYIYDLLYHNIHMIYYEEMAYAIKKGYHSQDLQGELVSWRPRAADDIV